LSEFGGLVRCTHLATARRWLASATWATALEVRRSIRHLFLFIGANRNADWLAGSGVALDPKGFVLTGTEAGANRRLLVTSCLGVFANRDVRSGPVRHVAASVGEGAQVVAALHEFLAASDRELWRPANREI
jgi:thioredoxin reductase (NADPH)